MANAKKIIEKAREESRTVLTEMESKDLLRSLGIPTTQMMLATTKEDAVAMSKKIGYPCVLKVSSEDISHKSDAGGVKVGLADAEAVGAAWDAIMTSCKAAYPAAVIEGVTVQDMAKPGLEVIVGMSTDPQFGPVLMFGLGGVWVEVLKDVSFKLAPLTKADAAKAVTEIKAVRLLDGFRGSEPVDKAALEDILMRVSDFVVKTPEVKEMDLNPIFAYSKGAMAVDARVILESDGMSANTVEQLKRIFDAQSVALVGATDKEGSFGRLFVEGMRDAGCKKLYPINPKREDVLGIKCYPSISAVPEKLDLAILLTPPDAVLGLVKECVENKVGGAVVFASGFGELGPEGKEIEKEIGRIGREGGCRIVGPNCLGFFNPRNGVVTYPQVLMKGVPTEMGTVGGVSQSGSFVDYLVWFLSTKGVRFSSVVSCGNECDLAAEDYLEYLGQDDKTKTIVSYMEGVKDGRRFFEVAREVTKKKPIILWKGGMSEQGARAAASHTGALAGSTAIWQAMFKQAGIIQVHAVQDVVDCAVAFNYLPLPKGNRVAIITGQGGTGVGTADNCYSMGLEVPRPTEKTIARLREVLPPVGTGFNNPIDTGVASLLDPGLYQKAIEIVADDENVDMLLVISTPVPECLDNIAIAAKKIKKPLAVSLFALPESEPQLYAKLAQEGVAAYSDPQRAVYVLSRMNEYAEFLKNL